MTTLELILTIIQLISGLAVTVIVLMHTQMSKQGIDFLRKTGKL